MIMSMTFVVIGSMETHQLMGKEEIRKKSERGCGLRGPGVGTCCCCGWRRGDGITVALGGGWVASNCCEVVMQWREGWRIGSDSEREGMKEKGWHQMSYVEEKIGDSKKKKKEYI